MSSRRSRIFPKAPKKVKQPQFIAVSEEHLPPPPPSPSRSLKELRKQTLARIAQEEEDHKIAVAEIEADVAQYQAHFGVYRQQNSFNFRINQDVNGDFHVTNVQQNNTAFEQFFETENLRFNHFLSQKGNDLFFHLNSQKLGGTSDYNDAAGNFNPTSFKRKYLEMDKDFRRYDRRSKDEYRVMLDNLNDAALESEYLKYDTLTYSDSWKSDLTFKTKDALLIAYIPSDCGKSTLFRNFKHYYFDLDHLCSIGTRKHMKYRFLEWFSQREKDYSYLFNFLHSEIFLSRKLLRGKILLAHSPHEIPENLRSISTEVKLMVTRPHLGSKSYAFDYASLDNYFTDIAKVFLTPSDMHFYLYNLAVALGYNPFKFR